MINKVKMKEDFAFIGKQDYNLGFRKENIEMVIYSLICFFAPFFLGHPQWLVGTLVNASLILAALNLRGHKLLPVIMLPSLGVLAKGAIFGPFTMFLVYMIPFIWIGNSILVYAFKYLDLHHKLNKWVVLAMGAASKTLFLFTAAFVLFKIGILPALFMTTMGLFQLYTAVAGGVLALGVQAVKKGLSN